MSKEEEFKKHLRELVESKSFPFEESDWHSAKKVIDAQRRKKRRLPFILFFAGLGALAFLFWPGSDEQAVAVKAVQNPAPAAAPLAALPQSQNSNNIKQAGSENNSETKVQRTTEVLGQENKNADGEKTPEAISPSATPEPETNVNSEQGHAATLPPPEKPATEAPAVLPPAALPLLENNSREEPLKEKQEEPILSGENSGEKELSKDTVAKTNSDLAPSLSATLPASDSNTVAKENVLIENPVFKKKVLISAEGGFNVLFGWKGNEGAEGRNINPVLGLNYHGQVSEKLECSAGFNLTTIRGLNSFSDTSRITRYGFGEESEVTVISPRTLFYIHFPLRLMWNFNLKQSAGFNLEPGYLVNSSSTVETYVQSNGISEQQKNMEFGYTQGLTTFNLQFGLFYRQRLFDRIYLQPELFIGLKDLKNNDFFHSEITERSSGIKITLLYSLLHR